MERKIGRGGLALGLFVLVGACAENVGHVGPVAGPPSGAVAPAGCDGTDPNTACVGVLASGQGNCVVVSCPAHDGARGRKLLFDCGSRAARDVGRHVVRGYLARVMESQATVPWERQCKALSISHPHDDHYGFFRGAQRLFHPDGFDNPTYLYLGGDPSRYPSGIDDLRRPAAVVDRTGLGEDYFDPKDTPNAELSCDGPEGAVHIAGVDLAGGADDPNGDSIVATFSAFGSRVLLPGDVTKASKRRILARQGGPPLASDVLVAAHHGSHENYLEEWIAAVDPRVVLFSAAEHRSYGHPMCPTLQDLTRNKNPRLQAVPTHGVYCGTRTAQGWDWRTDPSLLAVFPTLLESYKNRQPTDPTEVLASYIVQLQAGGGAFFQCRHRWSDVVVEDPPAWADWFDMDGCQQVLTWTVAP